MVSVEPSGGPVGATIHGIDLSEPLEGDLVAQVRSAWLEHLVLCFLDQPLTADQYMRFAAAVGVPAEYPFVTGLPDYPKIIEVKKLPEETQNFGGIWHSDTVYLERPPMASMLLAREIPPVGGDTEFANMYLAYDKLPDDLKETIDPLRAVNSSAVADVAKTRADRIDEDKVATAFESEHPVVRTHPETGRKALYVNIAHTVRFVGWTREESRPVLERIFDHQVQDEFVWRLKWQPNMLTLWDNRCLLHNPINDYDGHLRRMHRITLQGDVPR